MGAAVAAVTAVLASVAAPRAARARQPSPSGGIGVWIDGQHGRATSLSVTGS
ncbi:acyl-CoA carboxylase epsilon subunit [Mycobacterium marinum]|uniref:acyl-CoA carboxylase epsilon subunit n=1 Tax=Mycobacterium marinum TaxID=1781 RepID=UPI00115B8D90